MLIVRYFRLPLALVSGCMLAVPATAAVSDDGLWQDVDVPAARARAAPGHRLLQLQRPLLQRRLAGLDAAASVTLSLPLPDGRFGRFAISAHRLLTPELAASLPEVHAFRGRGLDDPAARAVLSLTPAGLHGLILTRAGQASVYINPRRDGLYVSFAKRDHADGSPPRCLVGQASRLLPRAALPRLNFARAGNGVTTGDSFASYRLAVAATGEYTRAVGGTVTAAQTAIAVAANRVSGIFERDAAVRFELVDNRDIVFTDPQTDPYPDVDVEFLMGINQDVLDRELRSSGYDIGHLLTVGGGGVALLGSTCDHSEKAFGVSASAAAELRDDVFIVDILAHEIGHQLGATHTFNGNAGSCFSGGDSPQREDTTAVEPGSGSTIMSYAGICADGDSDQNIQGVSDDYFHAVSIEQIVAFAAGSSCDRRRDRNNATPAVTAGVDVAIPPQTPFELTGNGTDPDDDPLSFTWEQVDPGDIVLGDPRQGVPDEDDREGPLFRSFPPGVSPTRSFPRLDQLLGHADDPDETRWEVLPAASRALNFRLTARDGAGGVAQDQLTVTVRSGGGPFRVLEPSRSVSWRGFERREIRWRVGGTRSAPISCTAVDILFSADGGVSYPLTAARGVANSGNVEITVPNLATEQGKLKIKCSDNVFFALGEGLVTVREGVAPAGPIFRDGFGDADD